MKSINSKYLRDVVILFFIGIVSRIPFLEKFQSHWDGPQYSIAVIRYSLEQHTPAPPGYPLYIMFAKFFHFFINEPHMAVLFISVIISGIGAVTFYIIGRILVNRVLGIIASALFLTGTSFYYFGVTAYPYIGIPILSAAIATMVYLISFRKKQYGWLLGFLFAVFVGYRPQETPFILLLILFAFQHLKRRNKIHFLVIFSVTSFAWLIPYMQLAGGFGYYFTNLQTFLSDGAIPTVSLSKVQKNLFIVLQGAFFSFGIAPIIVFGVIAFYFRSVLKFVGNSKKFLKLLLFSICWIAPSLFFNIFVRTEHAGYQGIYLAFFLVFISIILYMFVSYKKMAGVFLICTIVFSNLVIFFYDRDPNFNNVYRQSSFHYSEIRKNDKRLSSKIDYIKANYAPENTILMTEPFQWRAVMYYFKNYLVVNINGIYETDVRYKYTIRESKNWTTKVTENHEFIYEIPPYIRNIILTDEGYGEKVVSEHKQVKKLDAGSEITIVSVKSGDVIVYDYDAIAIRSTLGKLESE